jgi:hypothetical protein
MTDRDTFMGQRLFREFYESWKIIHRERPSVCFTMNPSIFSSWWLSLLAKIYRFCLVTDLHTPNLKLAGLKKRIYLMIFNSGIRRSDIVMVTNEIYRESILTLNNNVVVIPDPLPVLKYTNKVADSPYPKRKGKLQVLFICSFEIRNYVILIC